MTFLPCQKATCFTRVHASTDERDILMPRPDSQQETLWGAGKVTSSQTFLKHHTCMAPEDPANSTLLINFWLSPDAWNFCRQSTDRECKSAPKRARKHARTTRARSDRASTFACHRCWLGETRRPFFFFAPLGVWLCEQESVVWDEQRHHFLPSHIFSRAGGCCGSHESSINLSGRVGPTLSRVTTNSWAGVRGTSGSALMIVKKKKCGYMPHHIKIIIYQKKKKKKDPTDWRHDKVLRSKTKKEIFAN